MPSEKESSCGQTRQTLRGDDGRSDREQACHKRHGLNTTARRDALPRQVASRFFTQEIIPPVKMRPAERVMQDFNKARAATARGEVAVDAIKALRPEKFAGVPEEQHEAIARQLQRGLPLELAAAAVARNQDSAVWLHASVFVARETRRLSDAAVRLHRADL